MGAAVSATGVAALMSGCKADVSSDWTAALFDDSQMKFLRAVTERICPKTDTPGANDVFVERFIDRMMAQNGTDEERNNFTKGLQAMMDYAKTTFGGSYDGLSEEEQNKVLQTFHDGTEEQKTLFNSLREKTFLGYFSSEKVCTEVLRYDPIPGDYQACIDYTPGDRIWSL